MKRKPTWAEIGSICEGHLNWTDKQIEGLSDELRQLLQRCRVGREDRKAFGKLLRDTEQNARDMITTDVDYDEPETVVALLANALATFAPPHAWFDEHDGEWGFWPIVDDDELPKLRDLNADGDEDFLRSCWGSDCYVVNDHGNVTCGRFDKRGRFTAYWSVV